MNSLSEHPAVEADRAWYAQIGPDNPSWKVAPKGDVEHLGWHLRSLLQLDPTAVYTMVGGSTVVYYVSPHAKSTPIGGCCRIVLNVRGERLRIGSVGFDPR